MFAVISDIHGNLEALHAVLRDISRRRIKEIFCLGDIIGYGPNPRECLQLSRRFQCSVRGNHEEAVLFYAEDFNEKARQAILWTRDQLGSVEFKREENMELWNFVGDMKEKERVEGMELVHGSLRQPTKDYLLPRDIRDNRKMSEIFSLMKEKLCFCGHSHIAGVFFEDLEFLNSREGSGKVLLDGRKAIINVGSVGQPRDGDNRACYVTVEGNEVCFRRLRYNMKRTMEKIFSIKELPDFFAYRLERGR